jgi:hypothetical protein
MKFQKECRQTGQMNSEKRKGTRHGNAVAASQSNPTECHALTLELLNSGGVVSERRDTGQSARSECVEDFSVVAGWGGVKRFAEMSCQRATDRRKDSNVCFQNRLSEGETVLSSRRVVEKA